MSYVTTHVLDAVLGTPAIDVEVTLTAADGSTIANGITDSDGRLALGPDTLPAGSYDLRFATGDYFARDARDTFYPSVTITFTTGELGHYHVPLLLSAFAYSTYRGS